MTAVTLRMPVDVVDDLRDVAPLLGFSGYQPLMWFYVGSGLRRDLERLEDSGVGALVSSLRRQGVDEAVLQQAIADVTESK